MSVRWTEQDLEAFRSKRPAPKPQTAKPAAGHARFALGRLPAGAMNKTEQAYDRYLWDLRHSGEVLWHKFEGIKLRLADNTFLTVDFAVLMADGMMEMREVKGFMMDDANVKIKVAASIYPFKFKVVRIRPKKLGGGWTEEEI